MARFMLRCRFMIAGAGVFALLSVTALCAVAAAAERDLYKLTADEKALVEAVVAEGLLDPRSILIREIIAAEGLTDEASGQQIINVCGNVQGANALGGMAQPTPFFASIVKSPGRPTQAILIAIAGPSNDEKLRVLNACIDRLPPTAKP